MPIKDYPLTQVAAGLARPMVWIRLFNPATKRAVIALALVDTGADDCVFPAKVAIQLGYKPKAVISQRIKTASGTVRVGIHKYRPRVDILEMRPDGMPGQKVLHTIRNTPINFITRCEDFLLGTRNFLSAFVVTINYPGQVFSIRKPKK